MADPIAFGSSSNTRPKILMSSSNTRFKNAGSGGQTILNSSRFGSHARPIMLGSGGHALTQHAATTFRIKNGKDKNAKKIIFCF